MPMNTNNRSKITNGTRLHARPKHGGVDGRSPTGRRWRDAPFGFEGSLGHPASAAKSVLLRSAADLALRAKSVSTRLASGRAIDDGELNRLSFSLRRTLQMLGLTGGTAEPADDRARRELLEDREVGL